MQTLQILKYLYDLVFKDKKYVFWMFILALSALGSVVSIYFLNELINHLTEDLNLTGDVILLLIGILAVNLIQTLARIISKNYLKKQTFQIELYTQKLLYEISDKGELSNEVFIQVIRNLSDSLRNFLINIIDQGVLAVTELVAIPIILLNLNIWLFVTFIGYISVYVLVDYITTKIYEHKVDTVNRNSEKYYEDFVSVGKFKFFKKYLKSLFDFQQFQTYEWISLQSISNVAFFLVILITVLFILDGQFEVGALLLYPSYQQRVHLTLNQLSTARDNFGNFRVALERVIDQGNLKITYLIEQFNTRFH
jgi:hypothetical protein